MRATKREKKKAAAAVDQLCMVKGKMIKNNSQDSASVDDDASLWDVRQYWTTRDELTFGNVEFCDLCKIQ